MAHPTRFDDLLDLCKRLVHAERASKRAAAQRGRLPAGSPRSLVEAASREWGETAKRRDALGCRVCAEVQDLFGPEAAPDPDPREVTFASLLADEPTPGAALEKALATADDSDQPKPKKRKARAKKDLDEAKGVS